MAMFTNPVEWVGFVGGMLIAVGLIPQLYTTWKAQSAAEISYSWQCIYIVGLVMLNFYGVYFHLWAVYIPGLVELLCLVLLTIMKASFDLRDYRAKRRTEGTLGAVTEVSAGDVRESSVTDEVSAESIKV